MEHFTGFISALILVLGITFSGCQDNKKLFVGKFTETGEKGFCIYEMNSNTATLSLVSEWDAGPNPAYFCISGKNGFIYTINEVSEFSGTPGGGLTTLKYSKKTGLIEKINTILVPDGGPCYISLSPENTYLFLANYEGGSVTVVKLDEKGIPETISDFISYNEKNAKVSHPHMISFDPSGKRVYVTDLGLDRVMIYNFDPFSGKLNPSESAYAKLPEGSGPRHFAFNNDGTFMYVINELNSTISVFEVVENGGLKSIQNISTLREGFIGKSYCADIHIGNTGRFLYGSNRGENSIVTFEIAGDGTLVLSGHVSCGGDWPRNFVIDPTGKFLLVGNQKSGNISVLKIDKKTGIPVSTGKEYSTEAPGCLKFENSTSF